MKKIIFTSLIAIAGFVGCSINEPHSHSFIRVHKVESKQDTVMIGANYYELLSTKTCVLDSCIYCRYKTVPVCTTSIDTLKIEDIVK